MKLSELLAELDDMDVWRTHRVDPEVDLVVGGDGAIHRGSIESINVITIAGHTIIELSTEED